MKTSFLVLALLLVGWSSCKRVVRVLVNVPEKCVSPCNKPYANLAGEDTKPATSEIRSKIISRMCKGTEMDGLHGDCDLCKPSPTDTVQLPTKQKCVTVVQPPKEEEACSTVTTLVESSGCDGCKCVSSCVPNVLLLHSKVTVTAPLCDKTRTIFTTKTFLVHSTHTRTQQAIQWVTGHQDHYCTNHTTTIISVTVESVRTKFVTRPCTHTVYKTKSALVTSTREFICIENKPVTNTTIVIETTMIPSAECTTTEIETVYE